METEALDVSLLYARRFLVLVFPSRGAIVPGFSEFVKNDERKISNVSWRAQPCANSSIVISVVVPATAKKCTRA
jgi:hypothetical protein